MKSLLCALSIIALPIVVNGDTLTLTNNSSLNGSVRYEDGKFYIKADYPKGSKQYIFPRDAVTSDEINNETFNQGAPPPGVKAYRVKYSDWVAVNMRSEGMSRGTTTGGRSVPGSRRAGQQAMSYPDPSVADESRVTMVGSPSSSSSNGRDTLTLSNNQKQTGTLRSITSDSIAFRQNGQQTDTKYNRHLVKLVTVR